MITITNSLSYLKKLNRPILNLSTVSINLDTIDISEKVFFYKKKLEKDYLTNIETLNYHYKDNISYIFSDLSWRSYFVKDPFIHIIYYFILSEYIKNENDDISVFIESEELLRFIKSTITAEYFIVTPKNKLKNFFRPLFYVFKLFSSKIRYSRHKTDYTSAEVLLYSFPLERNFTSNCGWKDGFLGNLYDDIKKMNINIFRFSPLEPNNFEKELFERKDYLVPLIHYFQLSDILKILFVKYNTPKNLDDIELRVDNIEFNSFYKQYIDIFLESNQFFIRYSFHLLFERLLLNTRPKIVIYPYENQPWEKSINVICEKHSVKSIAIQHSLLCNDMYYLYNKGLFKAFLPSYILSNATYGTEVIREMNDEANLITIGTKRHVYTYDKYKARDARKIYNIAITFSSTYELFDIVKLLNTKYDQINAYTFYLKPPPEPYSSQMYKAYLTLENEIRFNHFFVKNETLEEIFDTCDTIVFISTTVGLEAYIENKITIRYSTSTNYDLNLTEKIKNGIYFAKYNNFIDILKVAIEQNIDNEKIDIEYFFKTWDDKTFNNILLTNLIGNTYHESNVVND